MGERVLVNAKGRTLYVLTPETSRPALHQQRMPHLAAADGALAWDKVSGAEPACTAGSILQRKNGILQVTLNGLPLYRFAEDRASGEVNGQNFKGFGGIWHVLGVSGAPSSTAPVSASAPAASTPTTSTSTTTTPTMTTPTTTTPSYPGYRQY